MQANEVIDEIRQLPDTEAEAVYQFLFSAESELDRLFAAFDLLPRAARLTEEEILTLPRAPRS
jgi:hypothetical protein